jgi:hypothetical protein
MCLKPTPPRLIPEATAALVRNLFPKDAVYQFVVDVLFNQFRTEDFADLYPKDDQLAWSPRSLTPRVESEQENCTLDEVRHVPQTAAAPADPA